MYFTTRVLFLNILNKPLIIIIIIMIREPQNETLHVLDVTQDFSGAPAARRAAKRSPIPI